MTDGAGHRHSLSRYWAAWDQPRPESWREDAQLAQGLPPAEAARLWRDVASAAESGWDFSSRWFVDGASLGSIRTTRVLPADLNGLLLKAERAVERVAREAGDGAAAAAFAAAAEARWAALRAVHWDPQAGRWRDRVLPDGDDGPVAADELGARLLLPMDRPRARPGYSVVCR